MALIIPTKFTAVDGVSPAMRAMGNSVTSFASKAEGAINRADRAMHKYTEVLSHAQKELLGTISAAAVAYKGIEAIEFGFDSVKEYDAAITKLQTNFRLSDAALVPFKKGIAEVAAESFISADKISEVFNVIGSNNRELLNEPEALAAVAKSSVTLSEALKTDLIPTTQALSGVMKTFNLTDSAKTIDIIAAASSSGNVKGLELTEALSSVGLAAKNAHVSLSQTAAAIEFLDSKAALGAESGGAFQKMLLKMEQKGLSYKGMNGKFDFSVALENMTHYYNRMNEYQKNTFLKETFGNKNVDKARAFFQPGAIEQFKEYQKKTEAVGLAEEMAAKNTATLEVAMERVKGAFANAFIQSDKVGTAMNTLKNILVFVYQHMDGILTIIGYLIAAFIIWKGVVLASAIAIGIFNVAMGIMGAVTGVANIAIADSAIAMTAYKTTLFLATGAQWLWNAAISAGAVAMAILTSTITLIIAGIALLISMTASFARNWDMITSSFKEGGIVAGLKAIGATILDAVLAPLEYVLKLIAKITGANWAASAAKGIDSFRTDMGITTNEKSDAVVRPAINSKAEQQNALVSSISTTQRQQIGMDISLAPGLTGHITQAKDMIPINLTSTMGAGLH